MLPRIPEDIGLHPGANDATKIRKKIITTKNSSIFYFNMLKIAIFIFLITILLPDFPMLRG